MPTRAGVYILNVGDRAWSPMTDQGCPARVAMHASVQGLCEVQRRSSDQQQPRAVFLPLHAASAWLPTVPWTSKLSCRTTTEVSMVCGAGRRSLPAVPAGRHDDPCRRSFRARRQSVNDSRHPLLNSRPQISAPAVRSGRTSARRIARRNETAAWRAASQTVGANRSRRALTS